MTSLVTALTSRLPRGLTPHRLVALAAGVIGAIGVVAVATDHYGLAIVTVLLVQTALVLLVVEQRESAARAETALKEQVNQASSRTLADLSRVRHAVLTAIDESRQNPSR
ncbi:MAG: hypothetical protein JWP31_879 [Aeromicrobium sp.]|nr:hypothetical protein [Aeromicrobium sp.]